VAAVLVDGEWRKTFWVFAFWRQDESDRGRYAASVMVETAR